MFLFSNNVIIILCCLNKHRINNQQYIMHQYSVFNSVYYPKERENVTINEIYSDLRHVTSRHDCATLRGWGRCLARDYV